MPFEIDPVTAIYYGLVCAVLAAYTPRFMGRTLTLALGAVVGVAASAGLPELRAMLGL